MYIVDYDIFNALGKRVATVKTFKAVVSFTGCKIWEAKKAIRFGSAINGKFRVYKSGIYETCPPIDTSIVCSPATVSSSEFEKELEKQRKERIRNIKRATNASRLLNGDNAVDNPVKNRLLRSIFVEYDKQDRCAKCILFDIATDEQCLKMPCDGGYFRLMRTHSSDKEY